MKNSPETDQAIKQLVDDLENVGRLRKTVVDLEATIARQAKVIEQLKLQRGTILHEKYAGFPLLAVNAESDLDKELTVIEQRGEGT